MSDKDSDLVAEAKAIVDGAEDEAQAAEVAEGAVPEEADVDSQAEDDGMADLDVSPIVDMPDAVVRPRAGDKVPLPDPGGKPIMPVIPEGDPYPRKGDKALGTWREELIEELQHLRQHVSHTSASAIDALERTYEWAHRVRREALAKAIPDLVKNAGLAGEQSYAQPHASYAMACALCAFEDEDKQWWIERVQAQVSGPSAVDVDGVPVGAQFSKWDREELKQRIQEVSAQIEKITHVLAWREVRRRNIQSNDELAELEASIGMHTTDDAPAATYGGK